MSTLTLLASTAMLAGPLSSVFGSHEMIFWKGALWISGALWLIYIICVGLDDIAKHAKNAFKYNLIALAVVFVGVLVYAKKHDSSGNLIPEDSEKQSPGKPSLKDFADQEFEDFKSGEGRVLWDKIKEIEIQDTMLSESIKKMKAILLKAKKDPDLDEDYQSWIEKRRELREVKAMLEKQLMDAFVAYQKYKLTPTGEQEDQWRKLLADGVQDAERLKSKYEDIKQQLEGNSTETPGDANATEANKTEVD